jgi:hypothetical protein
LKRKPQKRETLADRLASKKRADAYITRDGQAPSALSAAADGKRQDLNDDDRRHLMFCLKTLREAIFSNDERLEACLDFVEALLTRDYDLSRKEKLNNRKENSRHVSQDEDPELYRHLMSKR